MVSQGANINKWSKEDHITLIANMDAERGEGILIPIAGAIRRTSEDNTSNCDWLLYLSW